MYLKNIRRSTSALRRIIIIICVSHVSLNILTSILKLVHDNQENLLEQFSAGTWEIPLQKGCTLILLVYLLGNFVTVFTCVSIFTIGDSLFLSKTHHKTNQRRLVDANNLVTHTWNYSLIFIFITSCQREFIWISITAVGLNVLAFIGVLVEIPAFMIPFLIYEISVNTFFSYFKILWCIVYGLAIHAPIEFILFLLRIYFWLVLLSYCVRLYKDSDRSVSSIFRRHVHPRL